MRDLFCLALSLARKSTLTSNTWVSPARISFVLSERIEVSMGRVAVEPGNARSGSLTNRARETRASRGRQSQKYVSLAYLSIAFVMRFIPFVMQKFP